jgi:hypothetical protein
VRADHTAPWGVGGRLLPSAGAPSPRERGIDPMPPLDDDYSETIHADFVVNLTSTEASASHLIYGPFRIDSIGGRTGVAGTNAISLAVCVANNDATAIDDTTARQSATRELLTDQASRFVGGLYLTTLWTFIYPRFVERGMLSRVVAYSRNFSAANAQLLASIVITHLRPRCGGADYQ